MNANEITVANIEINTRLCFNITHKLNVTVSIVHILDISTDRHVCEANYEAFPPTQTLITSADVTMYHTRTTINNQFNIRIQIVSWI